MNHILHILWIVLVVSGIVVVIWLLDRVPERRAGYRWRKVLWLILAVCLLFPVQINLDTGDDPFYGLEVTVDVPERIEMTSADDHVLTNENIPADEGVGQIDPAESAYAGQNAEFMSLNTARSDRKKQIRTDRMILGIWIAGVLFMAALRICQYYRMRRVYMTDISVCEETAVAEKAYSLRRELGIKKQIPIRIMKQKNGGLNSPVLMGYLHPVLLLPDVSYTPCELNVILRHEFIHYQSGDLWYKLLIMAVCDIYWFDPLLRLMKQMAFRDVECVCDEKVTRDMDLNAKKNYSNTILRTMSGAKKIAYAYTTQFSGSKKSARERFNNIFSSHSKKAGIAMLGLFLMMLAAGLVCVSVTSDQTEGEAQAAESGGLEESDGEGAFAKEMQKQQEIPEATKKITIDAGILPEYYDSVLDELKAQYPDYEIDVTDFDWDYRMALFEDSEEFPTIFQVYDTNVLKLAEAGRIADVTDILRERGWLDQMDDVFQAAVSVQDGRVYGIPEVPYAFGLMVNVEMFREAGLVDESGVPMFPATWEELAEDASRIKEATGEAGFCLIAGDVYGSVQFFNLAWCFGATDLMTQRADGSYKTNLDSREAIAAMKFVQDLRWKYDVLTKEPGMENYNTGYEHIAKGTAAMYLGANDAVALPAAYGMEKGSLAMGPVPAGPEGEQYSYYNDLVFVFSDKATSEEIDIALSLLEMLGLGPAANDAAKSRIYDKLQRAADQGGPLIPEISVWNNEELLAYEQSAIDELGNTDQILYQSFFDTVHTPGNLRGETFLANSELCLELWKVLQIVVADPDADVAKLMKNANEHWQEAIDMSY